MYGEHVPSPHYGQPRYRAIADELRDRIQRGIIPSGALLPTEGVLTTEFQASRGTVRQAIAALRDERLVATEHGRGTYVIPLVRKRSLDEESDGETRQRKMLADPELADLFAVEVGTTLIEEQSVTRKNGIAETVVRTYRVLREK